MWSRCSIFVGRFLFSVGTPPQMLWDCLASALAAPGEHLAPPTTRDSSPHANLCESKKGFWTKSGEESADCRFAEATVFVWLTVHEPARRNVCQMKDERCKSAATHRQIHATVRSVWKSKDIFVTLKVFTTNPKEFYSKQMLLLSCKHAFNSII